MPDEIKRCPFCGSDAELVNTTFGDSNVDWFRVQCRNGDALDSWESPVDAINTWNRRVGGNMNDVSINSSHNKQSAKCQCGADAVYHYCRICWCMEIDSHKQADSSQVG